MSLASAPAASGSPEPCPYGHAKGSPPFQRGVFLPEQGRCPHPGRLVVALVEHAAAQGAFSGEPARQLGTRVRLESERGCHVMVHGARSPLRIQTISAERKFVAAPMENGLRLSGTVEFAGLAAKPNMGRADILLRQGAAMFPGLDMSDVERWMGRRPGTPDSIPVIERSRRHRNVIFAFGHGHRGMIGGSVTGRLVAELAADRPTSIGLTPFRSDRF